MPIKGNGIVQPRKMMRFVNRHQLRRRESFFPSFEESVEPLSGFRQHHHRRNTQGVECGQTICRIYNKFSIDPIFDGDIFDFFVQKLRRYRFV